MTYRGFASMVVHPIFLLLIAGMSLSFLLAFLWAWRHHQFENLEFTKYKVFNDSGPDEPQPSPFARMEREPNPDWIKFVLGLMSFWLLFLLTVFIMVQRGIELKPPY